MEGRCSTKNVACPTSLELNSICLLVTSVNCAQPVKTYINMVIQNTIQLLSVVKIAYNMYGGGLLTHSYKYSSLQRAYETVGVGEVGKELGSGHSLVRIHLHFLFLHYSSTVLATVSVDKDKCTMGEWIGRGYEHILLSSSYKQSMRHTITTNINRYMYIGKYS